MNQLNYKSMHKTNVKKGSLWVMKNPSKEMENQDLKLKMKQ